MVGWEVMTGWRGYKAAQKHNLLLTNKLKKLISLPLRLSQ